jgi:hypothetical protein
MLMIINALKGQRPSSQRLKRRIENRYRIDYEQFDLFGEIVKIFDKTTHPGAKRTGLNVKPDCS